MAAREAIKQKVLFGKTGKQDFYPTVSKRVKEYFEKHCLSTKGTPLLYLKGVLLALIYAASYLLLLSDQFELAGIISLYAIIGICKGQIGFNIIHDALHGAYTSNSSLNRFLGYWFDLNGTSSYIWKISHNGLHHTYTNIPGVDRDIDKAISLRLNPKDKRYWFHRYQHLYAPFLYCLIGINWVFYADFVSLYKEFKEGKKVSAKEVVLFFLLRLVNWILFLILPLFILSVPYWYVLLGYLSMHVCGGIMIAVVFQLAHVVEGVDYGQPEEGMITDNWASHEMRTTANFSTQSRLVTELTGGLNHQIEHHLFPHISHVHYPAIAKIVKETAQEFGLPYHEYPSFFAAVNSHFRLLKKLGNCDTP